MDDLRRDTSGIMTYILSKRRQLLAQRFKDCGLHESQHKMLMYIHRRGEKPPTQIEIANFFGVSAAAVAVTIRKLEQGGYITRIARENDLRNNEVYITDKGKDVAIKSIVEFDKCEELTYRGMSREDIQRLRGYLDIMYKNVYGEDR